MFDAFMGWDLPLGGVCKAVLKKYGLIGLRNPLRLTAGKFYSAKSTHLGAVATGEHFTTGGSSRVSQGEGNQVFKPIRVVWRVSELVKICNWPPPLAPKSFPTATTFCSTARGGSQSPRFVRWWRPDQPRWIQVHFQKDPLLTDNGI